MKICIITARIPPTHCGVGDHSVQVGHELVAQGHDVTIVCGREQASTLPDSGIRVRNVVGSWGLLGVGALLAEIPLRKPDLILVQWVPHLYSKRGTSLGLALAMCLAKIDGARIHTIVHEPYVEFSRPSFFITGPIQRFALAVLTWASSAVLVTIQPWVEMLKNRFKWAAERITYVPVGSNIPVVPVTVSERDHYRSELGILPNDVAIGVFSLGGAGKLYGYIAESMQAMLKSKTPTFWVFIGVTDEEFVKYFPKLKKIPHYCTGYLSADKVSRWLQSVDLLAAPFDDGVSTRRTSVIAGMAHGVPTITTAGHLTDEDFYEKSPLLISPLDAGQFAEMVMDAGKDLKRLRESRGKIREFYKEHFRWKAIVEGLLSAVAPPDKLKKSA